VNTAAQKGTYLVKREAGCVKCIELKGERQMAKKEKKERREGTKIEREKDIGELVEKETTMDEIWFAVQKFIEEKFWPVLVVMRRVIFCYRFRKIPLTHCKFALVDADDYEWLSYYKWIASKSVNGNWYAVSSEARENPSRAHIPMHRLIMNAPDDYLVDHRDRRTLDNRRVNLRLASPTQNQYNAMKPKRKDSTSNYRGVSKSKLSSRWTARISVGGRRIGLGTYSTEIEAAKAYDRAARIFHGQFATVNFS